MFNNIDQLAHLKYASNVVEKCFTEADLVNKLIVVEAFSKFGAA